MVVALVLGGPASAVAQDPTPAVEQPSTNEATLLQQVLKQQTEILENQAKIDQAIATIQELVRQAGIFAARGGGGGGGE